MELLFQIYSMRPNFTQNQRHDKIRKLQTNFPDEHRYKNPQQNTSELNSTTCYKDHTP